MLSIQEIEQAVSSLPREEFALFREWFDEFDARKWDTQFEADAKAGKLNKIAEQAMTDYRSGKAKEL
jgi:hypothetical protein